MYPRSPFLSNPLVESQILKRNPAQAEQLMNWLCRPPTITTYRVNSLQTSVPAFKQRLQQVLQERYTTQTPKVFEISTIPEVLCISPTKVSHEVLKQNRTEIQREVVVDSCCGAALLRGAHIYAPGVLAMEAGTKLDEQVLVYADLAGSCRQGTNTRYESKDKLFLGIGIVRMQRLQIFGPLTASTAYEPKGVAVEMIETLSGVPTIGDLSGEEALLQNLPSIVCARVLQPQAGERILDMCAAPGNKTTHIAELMGDHGEIIALDKVAKKIAAMEEKLRRKGLKSIRTYAFDATKAYDPTKAAAVEDSDEALGAPPPFAAYTFDKILLDAPCSALGNRPMLTALPNMSPHMLDSYPKVQRKLFSAAVPLLKPGGVLVYSTCTVTEEENECMVAWVLEKFPQMKLVAAEPRFGGCGLDHTELNEEERCYVQRFGPDITVVEGIPIDTVGFFIAKFVKKS